MFALCLTLYYGTESDSVTEMSMRSVGIPRMALQNVDLEVECTSIVPAHFLFCYLLSLIQVGHRCRERDISEILTLYSII